jgi:hypothetical protein
MEEKTYGQTGSSSEEIVKDVTKVLKKVSVGAIESEDVTLPGTEGIGNTEGASSPSKFKVSTSTALEKPSLWSKIRGVLLTEFTIELTPYQQKIENEINEFLHAPITWKSLKEAALSEVPITFMGKRIF